VYDAEYESGDSYRLLLCYCPNRSAPALATVMPF
jgi:hypothetical protein